MSTVNLDGSFPIDPMRPTGVDGSEQAEKASATQTATLPSSRAEITGQSIPHAHEGAESQGQEAVKAMLDSMERSVDLMARYQGADPQEKERILANFKKEMHSMVDIATTGDQAASSMERATEKRQGLAWLNRVAGLAGDPTAGWAGDVGAAPPIKFLFEFAQQDLSEFTTTNSNSIAHLNTDLEGVTSALNALSMVQGIAGIASWMVQGNLIQKLENSVEQMKQALPKIEERGIDGVDALLQNEIRSSGNFDDLCNNLEKHGIFLREVNHALREAGLDEIGPENIDALTKKETLEVVQKQYVRSYRNKILDLHSHIQVQKEIYSNIGVDAFTTVGRKLLSIKPVVDIFAHVVGAGAASAYALGIGNAIALGAAIYEYKDVGETQERLDEFERSSYAFHGTKKESGEMDFSEFREETLTQKVRGIVTFVRKKNSWFKMSPKIEVDRVRQQLSMFGVDFDRLNQEHGPLKRYSDFAKDSIKEGIKAQLLETEKAKADVNLSNRSAQVVKGLVALKGDGGLDREIDEKKVILELKKDRIDFEALKQKCGPIERYSDLTQDSVREEILSQLKAKNPSGMESPVTAMLKKARDAEQALERRFKGEFDPLYEQFLKDHKDADPTQTHEAFIDMIAEKFGVKINMEEIRVIMSDKKIIDGADSVSFDHDTLSNDKVKGFLLNYIARSKQAMSTTLKNSMKLMRIDKSRVEKKISLWRRMRAALKIGSATAGIILGISLVVLASVGIATAGIMTGGAIILAVAAIGIMAVGIYKLRKNRPQAFASLLSLEGVKYKYKEFQISRKTYRKLQGDLSENRRLAKERTFQLSRHLSYLDQRIALLKRGRSEVPENIWQAAIEGIDAKFPNILYPPLEEGKTRSNFDDVKINEIGLHQAKDQIHKEMYALQKEHLQFVRTGYALDLAIGGLGSQYRDVSADIESSLAEIEKISKNKDLKSEEVIKDLTTMLAGKVFMTPPLQKRMQDLVSGGASLETIKKYLKASIKKEGYQVADERLEELMQHMKKPSDALCLNFQFNLMEAADKDLVKDLLTLTHNSVSHSKLTGLNTHEMRSSLISDYSQALLDHVQRKQKQASGYADSVQFVSRFKRKITERSWDDFMISLGYTDETQEARNAALKEAKEFRKMVLELKDKGANSLVATHPDVKAFLEAKGIKNNERFFERWNSVIRDLKLSSSSSWGEADGANTFEGLGHHLHDLDLKEIEKFDDIEDTSIIFDAFAKVFNAAKKAANTEALALEDIEEASQKYKQVLNKISDDHTPQEILDHLASNDIHTSYMDGEIQSLPKAVRTAKLSDMKPEMQHKIKNLLWMQIHVGAGKAEAHVALSETLSDLRKTPEGIRILTTTDIADSPAFKASLVSHYGAMLSCSQGLEKVPEALMKAAKEGSLDSDTIEFIKDQINVDLSSEQVSGDEVTAKFKEFLTMDFDTFGSYLRAFSANQSFGLLKA